MSRPTQKPTQRPGALGGTRDTNRRKRKRDLADAAVAVFLEKGIDATTVDDIVARARVAKGSFYRYHESKEALVEEIFAPLSKAVLRVFADAHRALNTLRRSDIGSVYETMAGGLAEVALDAPDRIRLYLQECRGPNVGARKPIVELSLSLAMISGELTIQAQMAGYLRPVDAKITSLAVIGAVERLLHAALSPQGEGIGNAAEAAEALISMVLDGLKTEGKPPRRRSSTHD